MRKLILLGVLVLTGCAPPAGTRPLVKIGLAAPFEGLERPLGYEALAGVKLALAERNAVGGVGGYKVELVALNDFAQPEEARLQAKEFAADPAVVGVITGWTSDTARAAWPEYRQAGLPVVMAWTVPPDLAERQAGIVLLAADVQRVSDTLAGRMALASPHRPVVVGDERTAAPYLTSLQALGLPAERVPPPEISEEKEWAKRLLLGRMPPPDAILLTTEGALTGEVLRQLSALNWTGVTFGGAETGSVHLIHVAGDRANGFVFASPAPAGRDVPGDYHHLSPRGVLAYDATHVLLDAIQLAIQQNGRPTRSSVAAALPTVRRQGVTGPIAFDAAGRRADAPVWLYNISNSDYPGQMLPGRYAINHGATRLSHPALVSVP